MPYQGSPIENVAQIAALIIDARNKDKEVAAQQRGQDINAGVMARGQDLSRLNALTQANAPTPLERNYATYQGMLKADQSTADFGMAAGFLPKPTTNMQNVRAAQQAIPGQVTDEEIKRGYGLGQQATMASELATQKYADMKQMAEDTMDGIEAGIVPPDAWKARGIQRTMMTAIAAKRGIDLNTLMKDYTGELQFARTMNQRQMVALRTNVDQASLSLDEIQAMWDRWKEIGPASGVRLVNKTALEAAKQLPGEPGEIATLLDIQIPDWVQEFAGVLSMGQAVTDDRLRLSQENLRKYWGTSQFDAALKQARRNIYIRKVSLDAARARTNTSPGYGEMDLSGMPPPAVKPTAKPTMTPPAAGTPPSSSAATPSPAPAGGGLPPGAQSGDVYLDVNGNLQTVP